MWKKQHINIKRKFQCIDDLYIQDYVKICCSLIPGFALISLAFLKVYKHNLIQKIRRKIYQIISRVNEIKRH